MSADAHLYHLRPQVVAAAVGNDPARFGPYVDRARTYRNVHNVVTPAERVGNHTPATSLGGVRPVYAADRRHEVANKDAATQNAAVAPLPRVNTCWPRAVTPDGRVVYRDPYANGGMPGQPFYENQAG